MRKACQETELKLPKTFIEKNERRDDRTQVTPTSSTRLDEGWGLSLRVICMNNDAGSWSGMR